MKPDRLDTLNVAPLKKTGGHMYENNKRYYRPHWAQQIAQPTTKCQNSKWASKGGEHPRVVIGQPKVNDDFLCD